MCYCTDNTVVYRSPDIVDVYETISDSEDDYDEMEDYIERLRHAHYEMQKENMNREKIQQKITFMLFASITFMAILYLWLLWRYHKIV